jgi:hypothetical protein
LDTEKYTHEAPSSKIHAKRATENEALLSGSGMTLTWERGNDPTKVLYNCKKNVQLQFNFTTAKKMYNCYFISQLQNST